MKKFLLASALCFFASLSFADDSYAAELYQVYCKSCHGVKGSGAPMAFDAQAWAPYLKKGLMRLVELSINGSGNMPPMGTCNECEPEDMVEIIEYMSQGK